MVRLEEVLAKINDLFAGEDFTPAEQQSWVEGLVTVLMDDDTIQTQAAANAPSSSSSRPTWQTPSPKPSSATRPATTRWPTSSSPTSSVKHRSGQLLGELVHENLNLSAR